MFGIAFKMLLTNRRKLGYVASKKSRLKYIGMREIGHKLKSKHTLRPCYPINPINHFRSIFHLPIKKNVIMLQPNAARCS